MGGMGPFGMNGMGMGNMFGMGMNGLTAACSVCPCLFWTPLPRMLLAGWLGRLCL